MYSSIYTFINGIHCTQVVMKTLLSKIRPIEVRFTGNYYLIFCTSKFRLKCLTSKY